MKNRKVLFLTICLLLIGISILVGFFILRKSGNEFLVVVEGGSISYKKSQDSEYLVLTATESEFESGTFIKTGKDSFAQVYLPDNSLISLDSSTEVQINVQATSVNVDQLVGNTWHRVWELTDGNKYEVKTPNTIASVRGTIFSVDVNNQENTSIVVVEENMVDVNQCENAKFSVKEGKLAKVSKLQETCEAEEFEMLNELKNSAWYKRNKLVDENFVNLRSENIKSKRSFRKKLRENLGKLELRNLEANNHFPTSVYDKFAPFLKITSPKLDSKDKLSTTESEVKISGQTNFLNVVSINGEELENKKGDFSKTVKLNLGENVFQIKVKHPLTKRSKERFVTIIRNEIPVTTTVVTTTTTILGTKIIPPKKVPSIALNGGAVRGGVNFNWTATNLNETEGFKILLDRKPSVTQSSATIADYIASNVFNYFWSTKGGVTYYAKVCQVVNKTCAVYSNEVSVVTP